MNILKSLEDIVGSEYVSDAEFIRESYSRGINGVLEENRPDFVIRPNNSEEISEIVKIAYNEKIPLIPRGGGAGLLQGVIPYKPGGIVIDTTRMNKILDFNENTLAVKVQCGITWGELNTFLMEKGYYTGNVGPQSGMSAVVGGGLSHNSWGCGIAKYGPVTNNCMGLKVVLPNKNGDIIETGSTASKYISESFNRWGLGPDLSGVFLGDNGIMGIKTEATLLFYPRPKYHSCKGFTLKRKPIQTGLKIFLNYRKKGDLGIFDASFIDDVQTQLMSIQFHPKMPPIFAAIKNVNPRGRAMLFYVIEAESQAILEENVRIVDEITENEKGVQSIDFGSGEGNIAKWMYEKNGHWQISHPLWGTLGPGSIPQSAEHILPMHQLPRIQEALSAWVKVNQIKIQSVGAIASTGGEFGLGNHTTIATPTGLIVWNKPEFRKLNEELWDSYLEALIKAGAMPYMTGMRFSRALIRAGAFSNQYYNFMRDIKKTLDPRGILSPGKYYLGIYGE